VPAGGVANLGNGMAVLVSLGGIAAVVVGAVAGTGDLRAGVLRELVVMGRSRRALFRARIPAGSLSCSPVAGARKRGTLSHTRRMSVVRVNGVELYYEERGAGEPIVCIHGTSGSAAVWVDAVDELAKHGRTISYDRRGCFRSERPEPYVTDVHEHADDAAAFIDALDAAPAIVIGRSYGGETAIDLALRYPDRVRALALLEAALLSMSEPATRWASGLAERVFAAAEEDESTVAETFLRVVVGDEAWEAFPEPAKKMFTGNGPAILAELRGGFLDIDTDLLGTISQPTLLVAGTDSPPAFAEVANLMAAAMPSARVEWVEGGHFINPAHPAVLRFVDDVLAAAVAES
jgi:pimeloyl-ACP methyl ester carboxylesterase